MGLNWKSTYKHIHLNDTIIISDHLILYYIKKINFPFRINQLIFAHPHSLVKNKLSNKNLSWLSQMKLSSAMGDRRRKGKIISEI